MLNGTRPDSSTDSIINRALMYSVYAYSVRWLHLTNNEQNQDSQTESKCTLLKKELSENLWNQARKQMYEVMSRSSYRSILALYLFAIIPTSSRKRGDSIEDLCLETALSHHNHLNSRTRMPHPKRDSIASLLDDASFSSMESALLQADMPLSAEVMEFKSMASIAFWFGIISDVTRALTRCRPLILLSGSNGDTKVWTAVRQHTQAFEKHLSPLRRLRTPISDDQVMTILQCAFALKTLVWAAITRVQDALVHQMSGTSLAEAVDAARDKSNEFEATFGQLLCLCQRDFMLLKPTTQMFYSKYAPRAMLHGGEA